MSQPIHAVRAGAAAVRRLPLLGVVERTAGRIPIVSALTGVGWTVLVTSVALWIAGARLGWREFILAAIVGLVVLAIGCLLMIGRTALEVTVVPRRQRIQVGDESGIDITVTNAARQPLVLLTMQLVVGGETKAVRMPFSLAPRQTYPTDLPLPGEQRGVVVVGPASSVRGDPFGLLQRRIRWNEATEVFVHPRTIRLDTFGSGLLHDLEGRTTDDVSMSDLAFHTLREYAPGDDRRYIHWPSSAKLSTARPEGTFLVRQFRDTRRTHVLVIVDGDRHAYADEEDFETAISVGASIGVRAARDKLDATVYIADQPAVRQLGHEASEQRILDVCSRATATTASLDRRIARASAESRNVTYALVVTGSKYPTADLRAIAARLPRSARVMMMSINPSARTGVVVPGGPIIVNLAHLDELRGLIRRGDLA